MRIGLLIELDSPTWHEYIGFPCLNLKNQTRSRCARVHVIFGYMLSITASSQAEIPLPIIPAPLLKNAQ